VHSASYEKCGENAGNFNNEKTRKAVYNVLFGFFKRRGGDSNPRYDLTSYDGLANRSFRPLRHLSVPQKGLQIYAFCDYLQTNLCFVSSFRIIFCRPRSPTPLQQHAPGVASSQIHSYPHCKYLQYSKPLR
jgi:hypothetical protein